MKNLGAAKAVALLIAVASGTLEAENNGSERCVNTDPDPDRTALHERGSG